MKNKTSKMLFIFAVLLAFFVCACTILQSVGVCLTANAAVTIYSDVLDDLQKDENFNLEDYPADFDDYNINVIQIAESSNGYNLYVYTYQPCMSTYAVTTEINMSVTENIEDTKLYSLYLVNCNGVFAKYLVLDYKVDRSSSLRHYNITSIYRKFIDGVDEPPAESTSDYISAVSFSVAQHWSVRQDGDEVYYDMTETKVIKITDKYLGHIDYTAFEFPWWTSGNGYDMDWNSWYVAFDTDLPIDKLISAKLTYSYWAYYIDATGNFVPLDLKLNASKTLKYDNKQVLEGYDKYFDHYTYKFNRIQSVDDFKSKEKLTESAKKNLEGKKWVLRFKETSNFTYEIFGAPIIIAHYQVFELSILRLEFETDGVHYNLGVVDNKMGAKPNQPGDNYRPELSFFEYVWRCIIRLFNGTANAVEIVVAVIALFIFFLLLPLLLIILSIIFPLFRQFLWRIVKAICKGLLWLLKGLWWLLCLPFRGIKALIDKGRGEE